ncbi:MAG: cadherin repeat domain-containing protein, partial [Ekhidna sp.]|nr:cadherin repeat domain-containing protein [Ekhidna sp.]
MLTACGDDDEPNTNKKEEDKPENTAPTIADQTFSIAEDAAVDAEVGTVTASDADDDELTFSVTSGNTSDAFVVNESSGLLTVAKALDFETDSTYTLKVSVSDGTDSNAADITINVTDVEEASSGDRLPD